MYTVFATKKQVLGKGIVNALNRDVWLAWNKFYNRDPVSEKEIQNESLWNNENGHTLEGVAERWDDKGCRFDL